MFKMKAQKFGVVLYKSVDGLGYDEGSVKVDYDNHTYTVYGPNESPLEPFTPVNGGRPALDFIENFCKKIRMTKIEQEK